MYSIPMALADLLPVLFFGWAGLLLQKDLYNKMSKGAFALFCGGTFNVFAAGFLKALYKLLYAANICDFQVLNTMFFPMQSIGFILAGAGMLCLVFHPQGKNRYFAAAPAVFKGTPIFIVLMVLGLLSLDAGLVVFARKLKKNSAILLIVLSFILSLGMGYLSTKDFTQSSMNWIAQGVNAAGQLLLLIGVKILDKAGLEALQLREN